LKSDLLKGTGKYWVAMGTEILIAVGVMVVELIAFQVSMVSAAKKPRYL